MNQNMQIHSIKYKFSQFNKKPRWHTTNPDGMWTRKPFAYQNSLGEVWASYFSPHYIHEYMALGTGRGKLVLYPQEM